MSSELEGSRKRLTPRSWCISFHSSFSMWSVVYGPILDSFHVCHVHCAFLRFARAPSQVLAKASYGRRSLQVGWEIAQPLRKNAWSSLNKSHLKSPYDPAM